MSPADCLASRRSSTSAGWNRSGRRHAVRGGAGPAGTSRVGTQLDSDNLARFAVKLPCPCCASAEFTSRLCANRLRAEIMNAGTLVADIRRQIAAAANRNVAGLRTVRREFSRTLRTTQPDIVLELALRLVGESQSEFHYRFLAYELVAHHPATLSSCESNRSNSSVQASITGQPSTRLVRTFPARRGGSDRFSDRVIHRLARWAGPLVAAHGAG